MAKKYIFVLLLLSIFILEPLSAEINCNRFCYDQNLPIAVGDSFNYIFESSIDYQLVSNNSRHPSNKGLADDFLAKLEGGGQIQIEIKKDLRGRQSFIFPAGPRNHTLENEYFDTSIIVDGEPVAASIVDSLNVPQLIKPTILIYQNEKLNLFENITSWLPETDYSWNPNAGVTNINNSSRKIINDIYTFSSVDKFVTANNTLLKKYEWTESIHVPTGFVVAGTYLYQDYELNGEFYTELSLSTNSKDILNIDCEKKSEAMLDAATFPLVMVTTIICVLFSKKLRKQ